jgi:S-adenosylmethionine decarboxylase
MKVTKLHGNGNHLLFDGICVSGELIDKEEIIEKFLVDVVDLIEMRAISEPIVIKHESVDERESGITGTIILADSNITIHTYPKKKWFSLDIYSCKEFDVDKAVNFVVKKLDVEKHNSKIFRRGFYG